MKTFGILLNSSNGLCSSEASFFYCVSSLLLRVKFLQNIKDGNLHDLNLLGLKITQHFLYLEREREQFFRTAITSIFHLSDSTPQYFQSMKIQEFKELVRHCRHTQRPWSNLVILHISLVVILCDSHLIEPELTPAPGFLRSLFFREVHSPLCNNKLETFFKMKVVKSS